MRDTIIDIEREIDETKEDIMFYIGLIKNRVEQAENDFNNDKSNWGFYHCRSIKDYAEKIEKEEANLQKLYRRIENIEEQ